MLTRVIDNPRVANAVAFLALFFAAGGLGTGAYAAIKLSANSVGSREIKKGAVHSSDIFDGGILFSDINRSARNLLRGQTGPPGATGPAGADAIKYFASVSAAGRTLVGNTKSGGRDDTGIYSVSFGASLASCVPNASLGSSDGSAVPAGNAHASRKGDTIVVETFDAANARADLPFQLIVAC